MACIFTATPCCRLCIDVCSTTAHAVNALSAVGQDMRSHVYQKLCHMLPASHNTSQHLTTSDQKRPSVKIAGTGPAISVCKVLVSSLLDGQHLTDAAVCCMGAKHRQAQLKCTDQCTPDNPVLCQHSKQHIGLTCSLLESVSVSSLAWLALSDACSFFTSFCCSVTSWLRSVS